MNNKAVILTDTHCGVRGDHIAFHDNMKLFYDTVMFPYIETNKIKKFIHGGDLLDKQQYTKTYSAMRLRTDLLEPLDDLQIECHWIVGNHDTPYKNSVEINVQREFITSGYKYMTPVWCPTYLPYGKGVLLLPWICKDNYDLTIKALNQYDKIKYIVGHLQLTGFAMHKGHIITEGYDRSLFMKFDKVLSGHYHERSQQDNIYYIGAAGEYDWADYDSDRGFVVFDFDTGELEYINNPYKMFHKIEFDGNMKNIDFDQYANKIVRVYVKDNPSQLKITNFLEKLHGVNPVDVQVADEEFQLDTGEEISTEVTVEVESTVKMIERTVDNIDVEVNKPALKNLLVELYNNALKLEK